jgi:sporulation related protein
MKSDRAVNTTGGPFGDRAAVAIVGESLSDVAREALKIARVESQSRPVLLVDLLGQGSDLDAMFADEDLHGVSDAARYGVSLGRVARPVPNADSLFVVSGGTESPQADDVMADHMWASWSDQCRRAGALLVVAAPADLHDVGKAIDQLDGLVMIGDAAVPTTHAPVIGRVPTSRRPVLADAPPRAITPAEKEAVDEVTPGSGRRVMLGTVVALAITGAVAGLWWMNGQLHRTTAANGLAPIASGDPIVMPGDPSAGASTTDATGLAAGAVPWSVEIASVNTINGAMARVRQALDSLPAPTFAATQPGGGSAVWYRLTAGAFTTSEAADSLLAALRARGAVEPAAGRVLQTPFAWLLEEGVLDEQLPVRLFGWRQQGLPAYALVDQNGTTRIYFGAFENEAEARLLTPVLDSLNLYATLATRIGSVR